jgi:transcription antitermination factor NusG
LPSVNRVRQWKDRKKTVTFPLFPGYIFVGTTSLERDKLAILKTSGVVNFVGQSPGEAEMVPPDQIIMLMKLVENKETIDPYPYLKHGSRVRIKHGPLSGVEGLLVERKGKHLLVLSIDILQQGVSVQVDAPNVEVI